MRIGRILIVLFLTMTAVIFVTLSCSKSTASAQTEYDWAMRIGYLGKGPGDPVFQGAYSDVPVYIDSMPDVEIDSFTFVIAHDPKALTFILAEPGEMISEWNGFTFSESMYDIENTDSSIELVKITGKRESLTESHKSGDHENGNAKQAGLQEQQLFSIKYYVTDDRNYECNFIPLNFFWQGCNDNTIYYNSGSRMAYSRNVYVLNWMDAMVPWQVLLPEDGTIDEDDHLYGAFDDCWNGTAQNALRPDPSIDFYNGGVDIACSDPIDYSIGDINMNHIGYEIADFYLFTNYFIYGDTVFTVDKAKQILATEMNHDHLYLTLADLVYMSRVLCGDALPTSHLQHNQDTVSVTILGDTLSFSSEIDLGSAYFSFDGDVDFDMFDSNFEVKSDYFSGKTRILIYSLNGAKFESGMTQILQSSDLQALDSCVFSGYYGNMVVTKMPE